MNIETIILQNLISNEIYTRKTIPYFKSKYFYDHYKVVFDEIVKYVAKYNVLPSKNSLILAINELKNDTFKKRSLDLIEEIYQPIEQAQEEAWLLEKTENWIKDRAITVAILDCVNIIEGKDKKQTRDGMPTILNDALGISFDATVGHDYFIDAENRHDFYTRKNTTIKKFPFGLDVLNKATDGGYESKSLNIIIGGTGGGKSLTLCNFCADSLTQGNNCLYITLEMADMKIAQRIDANLMDVEVNDLKYMEKSKYGEDLTTIKSKTDGRLVIKEYPAGSVHAGHFRALLNELKLKKNFEPDIVYIDYLNLCSSSRYKIDNSYNYVKGVAEELRGLAMEKNLAIWSATQFNREGMKSSDPGVSNTSESIGLAFTADFMIGITASDEMKHMNKLKITQIAKNRYESIDKYPSMMVGINRPKMKLYDLEN